MKISQSLLREFQKYLSGDACGVQFQSRYIDYTWPDQPSTPAQAGGHWFEFMCTGATPRNNGIPPEPVKTKAGELTAMYKYLEAHLPTWKMLNPRGALYGTVLSNTTAVFGHTLTGITDVLVPDVLIGDIKTTSAIDNKWEEYGWGGEAEYVAGRPAMFQAKYYLLLYWLNTGKILPFWFWVFANNSDKAKQIHVTMTEDALRSFLKEVEYLIGALEDELGQFKAVPSFERCRECPLECAVRRVVPDVMEINY